MRKKIIIISIISSLLLILLLGVNAVLIGSIATHHSYTSEWSLDITLSNGKAEPQMSHGNFGIEEDGSYNLSLKYLPKGHSLESLENHPESVPPFITGCVITDEQGRLQYATAGGALTVDTDMEMTAGTYNLDFYYLTDRDAYVEFAKTYLCGSAMAENFADGIDFLSSSEAADGSIQKGTWTMEYALGVSKSNTPSILTVSVLFGFLIGLCLLVLILALGTKGPEWKERYDERQELERGRGFKYAFCTVLFYDIIVPIFMNITGLSLAVDTSVIYFCGVFLGALVYMVYCIWHESYFALNQNMRSLMICFGLIGVLNLLIGLSNLLNGTMVQNGRLTFRVLNLLCAFLFLVLFLTMLVKKIVSSRVNSADEEDEKE